MRQRLVIVLAGALLSATVLVSAQDFPSKAIRFVATAPGAFSDISSRLIAQGLTARLGQTVIVENRGGNMVAIETVIKANPDGYTLLVYGNAVWLASFLHDHLPYDPMKDLVPVTLTTRTPNMLVVHPSVAAKSVAELITLAKARPGALNYGYGTGAGTPQIAAELFKSMAGINMVGVPYKGASGAVNGVIGGEIQLMFAQGSAFTHVKAGRLRGLAVTTLEPTALVPGLPTVAASGLPGYEVQSTMAAFVPAKTPEPVIRRLNQEIVATLNDPLIKQRFFDAGAETIPSTPAQAMAKAQAEGVRLGKVIKDAGIHE